MPVGKKFLADVVWIVLANGFLFAFLWLWSILVFISVRLGDLHINGLNDMIIYIYILLHDNVIQSIIHIVSARRLV